jgi:formyltetrahydrofolate deformylase
MERYILTLRCGDQPGIVRCLAEGIVQAKGNILESAQFSDPPTGLFCMRTSFESPDQDLEAVRGLIAGAVSRFEPLLTLRRESSRRRLVLARAVRLYAEDRVVLAGARTVVFG